jgi:hypothetical protein
VASLPDDLDITIRVEPQHVVDAQMRTNVDITMFEWKNARRDHERLRLAMRQHWQEDAGKPLPEWSWLPRAQ